MILGIGAATNGVSRWHPEAWRALNALDSMAGSFVDAIVGKRLTYARLIA